VTRATVARARDILEIFAEAQGLARETLDDEHARLRAWRLERWRENSANRRAAAPARVKPAARGGLPKLTKEEKDERRRAARKAQRLRVKAEIKALRAARKAAA
jgi:hypothetical protein